MNNKERKYGKLITSLAIGTSILIVLDKINSPYERNDTKTRSIVEEIEADDFQKPHSKENISSGPTYSSDIVPANMCSRYVRLAAKDLFGIRYPSADAWDIGDDSNVSEIQVKSKADLENLVRNGSFKPGMILGLYNPKSKYNNIAEEDGSGYTHVAIYLKQGENGEIILADKFGKETRPQITLDKMLERGNLQPREILFVDSK